MNKNLFKNIFQIFFSNLIIIIILVLSTLSSQAKTVNVAYFLEWPTPNQEAKVNKTYDKEMNTKLRWTNFLNGRAMIDAMLAGDIDIAYSPGLIPFINAAKSNAPIKMIGVSVLYKMGGTTCIVSNNSGISKNNAKKLEGKKVAVPLGTMAEYIFDQTMTSLGVDRKKIKVVNMDPQDGAKALQKGKVDAACIFGGNSIKRALKSGKRLLTVDEMFEEGMAGVDTILVTNRFLKNNRKMVEKFIEVTDQANENYKNGKSNLKIIAKDAAMKVSDAKATMSGFTFPSPAEQQFYLSKNGMTTNYLKAFGLKNYDKVVDISFLRAASKNIQIAKKEPKKEKIKKDANVTDASNEEYTSTASSSDTKPPIIDIAKNITVNKPKYFLTGKVIDESTIFLEVDGFLIPVNNGSFKIARYSPIDEDVLIKATDKWGNESTKTIKVKIDINRTDTVKKLEPLNPLKIKGKNKDNKIALIIGIEKYSDTVSADFANLDAKYFNEYAREVFNIKSENINLLTDNEATLTKINKSLFKWLAGKIKSDETEVIIFFAGHGLASNNGEELYFLPQDGDPDLLSRTAISRSDLMQEIVSLKPRSVTMFLDMCYSGVSRNEEALLASARPVRIVAGEQGEIPSNFTIFSASQLDQISSGLKEAKHGIFSYYVMKGLEGNADLNKDKEITNGELLAYINDNVSSKALEQGRKQNPELLGEKNKILIKY
ncbi:caspase family protein [Candidatus Pelagibacter sp.]|nr:caspase family protein [Candidatus Pelagibacter sp.]